MSNSSGGGIGIGTIVVCAFIFNILFCNDDKTDVKEVNVEVQDQYVSDETKKEIKENVQEAVTSAKKAIKEMKEKVKKEINIKKEGEQIDKAQDKQPPKKEVVERQIEKEKVEMDTKPMEKGTVKEEMRFKKL